LPELEVEKAAALQGDGATTGTLRDHRREPVAAGRVYPGSVVSAAEPVASRSHLVVRVRLGVDFDSDALEPFEFLDHVAERMRTAAVDAGVELDVLQVGVAGDPRWQAFGPDNQVEGHPIP
jgi:hypothetical protein